MYIMCGCMGKCKPLHKSFHNLTPQLVKVYTAQIKNVSKFESILDLGNWSYMQKLSCLYISLCLS